MGLNLLRPALLIALLTTAMAAGQAFAPTGSFTFDVASIKRTPPGDHVPGLHPAPGGKRYVGSNFQLRDYISVAYQVKPEQITGGPDWMDGQAYDLNAEAAKPSSLEELHIMLQNLLIERFKLQFHRERKEMPAYALAVDRGGPKNLTLHPDATGGDVNLNQANESPLHEIWTARCGSMDYFSFALSRIFDRPLVNQTGLSGCFDFQLKFTDELTPGIKEGQMVNGTPVDTYGPTIYQALQQQLGLKLEAKRTLVETMVIDHVERPTED